MSTGGIALLLSITPHRFPGLETIGVVVFMLDLVIFVIITTFLLMRFAFFPKSFKHAVTHPTESLFVPTFFLSVAAALSNIEFYGHASERPWLAAALRIVYWTYLAVTGAFSVVQYEILFNAARTRRRLTLETMTPAWILPIFPIMLAGTVAGAIAPALPPDQAFAVLGGGLAAQGLGFLVSVFMYSTYLSRLMTLGLPAQRPGMFMAVGPPSFTAAALVALSDPIPGLFADAVRSIGSDAPLSFAPLVASLSNPAAAADALRVAGIASAVLLWGLSFWFFAMALLATASGLPDAKFHLSWWAFVFPNVGFAVASIRIGRALGSDWALWMGTVMTIVLVIVWLAIGVMSVRAVVTKQIAWPGRDEDSD